MTPGAALPYSPIEPIRAELFSVERLEQHAETLANEHRTVRRALGGGALLRGVKKNARLLHQGFKSVAESIREKQAITPAAEWLADNFHIVEDQIREIIDDLPPGFYRSLPKLEGGQMDGNPRVYGIIWEFVAHTDSRLDPDSLKRFIQAYQSVQPLDIGEGWAIPIALRIILVENLSRITDRIRADIQARKDADKIANAFVGETVPASLTGLFERFESALLPQSFAVQLVQRLREQGAHVAAALKWLDQRLVSQKVSAEEIVRREHQEQTSMNSTVRNIITSMRLLSSLDWSLFFEEISVVDRILCAESSYGKMDFATRDLYRHAIEELSRGSKVSEVEVTRRVLLTARDAAAHAGSPMEAARQGDTGYHLVSRGRSEFERALKFRVPLKKRLLRIYISTATTSYLGSIALITGGFLTFLAYWTDRIDPQTPWLAPLMVLGIFPASELAIALVNRWVTTSLGPQLLPKLDYEAGIPVSSRTLVVMPTLLANRPFIEENLERLSIHYLSNTEGHLQFALLSDWTDASTERTPDDEALLHFALDGIAELNKRYGPTADQQPRFFLLHRNRLWNAAEKKWMGWERKRGKLHELNRLLRGATDTSFLPALALPDRLQEIRYVITLDADSRLSRGGAYQLAASMAHPLNQPRYDESKQRVVEGYGIIQPRITPTLPTTGVSSLFQWIFSGSAGIDPYAFAVSDVYQDLFKQGSYVGKGIYDIDAFERALHGKVPENSVLSHDLLEGLFASAGLVTEIEVFEEFPSHYEVDVARHHRWARGDWQLLPWIFATNHLPVIARWKMVDNLRRSLLPPSLLVALLLTWIAPIGAAPLWTIFFLTTIALPPLLSILAGLWPHRSTTSLRSHFSGLLADFKEAGWHVFLAVTFLPHKAYVMVDAIVRTLVRLLISHRLLLEWTSAAQAKNIYNYQLVAFAWRMISAPLIAIGFLASVWVWGAPHVMLPYIFGVLWLLSPLVAQRISLQTARDSAEPLSEDQIKKFRTIARRTWRFFETFITAETNHLPPDNFQEIPTPVVAMRTSPTNIGLALLSSVAAHDSGWLGLGDLIERLENTLESVDKLEKHRGHLFNWYDIKNLQPLSPLYVSTVDSGNLAGHLWTVASACRELSTKPLLKPLIPSGFEDILMLLRQTTDFLGDESRSGTVTTVQLRDILSTLENVVKTHKLPTTISAWLSYLNEMKEHATTLTDVARALAQSGSGDLKSDALNLSELLLAQSVSHLKDLSRLTDTNNVPMAMKERLAKVSAICNRQANAMEFGFLFDETKKLFSIGYQISERHIDGSYYDLLASESRLASYVAIAKGDVPTQHWFRLGRSLKPTDNGLVLLSWSGSMFEYLMPSLVMEAPQRSLLDQTCRRVVERQIQYGHERNVPWGVSESAYNAQNLEYTYQYSNFGVPGLGLKRGLGEDLVIAPYATALASMVEPVAAATNFVELDALGALGIYGYYESLDFTPTRLPEEQKVAVVRAYMAHHQGMSLIALTNVLHFDIMQTRFHAEAQVQATELLLQEKTPKNVPLTHNRAEEVEGDVRRKTPLVLRRFQSANQDVPATHLLSNGYYSVMITAAGAGYSRAGNMAVTRWREDTTRDNWGMFIFIRDVHNEKVWSSGYQPIGTEPSRYEVDFSEDRAEIIRQDGSIITTTEVVVSPEDNAEIRRIGLKNIGGSAHELDITSYAEVVLATPAADQAHPAFSNLFVQTEFSQELNGLLCTRRKRAPEDASIWMAHVVVVEGDDTGDIQYETDRAKFLGRGRNISTPVSIVDGKPLSNTVGAVLDPIVSLRKRVMVKPGESVHVTFTTVIAATRDDVLRLADKYHDASMFERIVTLAWTQAQVQQNYLGIEPSEAHLYQNLASRIIYADNGLRPSSEILKRNTRGAPGLWAFGISGDIPILLVRIDELEDLAIVRDILRAHEYWRMKNLAVDLVIINERVISYAQDLQVALENLVRTTQAALRHEGPGSNGKIFLLRLDQMAAEDHILLRTAARVTLLSRQGTLAQQVERLERVVEGRRPVAKHFPWPSARQPSTPEKKPLEFFNGLGGFSEDGKEYVTVLGPGLWTPAPWVNVISNASFGFHVSESGSTSTWSSNSRENQLTPWSNDPVGDPSGEIFYLRDEDTGYTWTPTVLPMREEDSVYTVRHGQGYSRFEHVSRGIYSELLQFVSIDNPIKISRLSLTNRSGQTRRISVCAYIEWVLGTSRGASAPFIITDYDESTGAVVANNPWNTEFGQRTAFAAWSNGNNSWTADRTEFLGRNGTLDHPHGIEHANVLNRRSGAGLDPCAALSKTIELRPGAKVDLVFFLGQEADRDASLRLLKEFQATDLDAELLRVKKMWEDTTEAVQITTPDRSMDILVNHWLLYQTLSCRVYSRAGFYQAGGAYGFRDQLQDIMALIVSRRDLAREHILRAAHRQFEEGDVQHWWHPPTGRGVRTKISDDLIWLPYVLVYYLEVTNDQSILDEVIPFLEGKPIPDGREDFYYEPAVSAHNGTLFEHCARALDRSLKVGSHGLPLMGTGDWNDGMNRIGSEGKGESVWLAWFLHSALWEFAKVAQTRNEHERAEKWRLHVGELKASLERNGWDGEWYTRAFFDDGKAVGSSSNTECRIDSIAQSWGVLSGAADPARGRRAMEAVRQNLVKKEDGLVLIFTPAFEHTQPSPGYIQGYVPGVRENGGQYTHAAIWAMLAFAVLGDGNTAGDLFSLLNPINHGKSRTDIHRYKVEPYVMSGDVYSTPAHMGRGGWSWYTGSASWMYRASLEWILGFRLRGDKLFFDPCIPQKWDGFEISFRYHSTGYHIKVENPKHVCRGVLSTDMDGKPIRGGAAILLTDDKGDHQIRVVLGN